MVSESDPARTSAPLMLLGLALGGLCVFLRPQVAVDQTPATPWSVSIVEFRRVPELPEPVAQFETVFWDARDTVSLRRLIAETEAARGKRVLEIGTGTGLLSLVCAEHGAAQVVATDVNPRAVANARYNAEQMGFSDRLSVRRVAPLRRGAYAVIGARERFDLIVSNPPWEDDRPSLDADYAFFDPSFQLLDSLLREMDAHLTEDGRGLLAYGCVSAIRRLHELAPAYGLVVEPLDDRELDSLDELFLPGMLLEVRRESR